MHARARAHIRTHMHIHFIYIKAFREGFNADIIYLVLMKPFDEVDHNTLLNNLYNTGMQGNFLKWTNLYLVNKMYHMATNGVR